MATKKQAPAKAPLDPKVANKLLDLLSSDNAFRRVFKKDPATALSQVGYKADQGASLACMSVTYIAPKAEIAAAREQLVSYLTSAGSQTVVFKFEAGQVSASTLRRK